MTYDIADSVPIAWDVKDSTGALVNASTATLTITLPDGTTATPAVTNPPTNTGQYRVTYVPTLEGRYVWRAVTTVPNTAYQDVFVVRPTASPALLSLADAKAHLTITSTKDDDKLREFIEAATGIIESYIGPVVKRSYTRRVCGYRSVIPLPHTQVLSIDNIVVVMTGTSPINLSDITIDSQAGTFGFKSGFPVLYGDMDVTYTVGRTEIKPTWTLAAKLIVKQMWETQLGNLPSVQGDDYVVTGMGPELTYRTRALLQPDQLPAGFA